MLMLAGHEDTKSSPTQHVQVTEGMAWTILCINTVLDSPLQSQYLTTTISNTVQHNNPFLLTTSNNFPPTPQQPSKWSRSPPSPLLPSPSSARPSPPPTAPSASSIAVTRSSATASPSSPRLTPLQRAYSNFSPTGANYQLWERRITDALALRSQPVDSEHKTQTLFFCSAPDTVSYDEFCFSNTQPTYRCQPPSANGCGHGSSKNDCCAPQI